MESCAFADDLKGDRPESNDVNIGQLQEPIDSFLNFGLETCHFEKGGPEYYTLVQRPSAA